MDHQLAECSDVKAGRLLMNDPSAYRCNVATGYKSKQGGCLAVGFSGHGGKQTTALIGGHLGNFSNGHGAPAFWIALDKRRQEKPRISVLED